MKHSILLIALSALSGCVAVPPGPAYYGTRAAGQTDPAGWQVVSVTPVAPGTGAQASGTATSSTVQYAAAPVYTTTPVYVPAPVYSPYWYDPYWYPPVSIGLGFSFGNSWGHRGGFRGHGFGRGGFRHR